MIALNAVHSNLFIYFSFLHSFSLPLSLSLSLIQYDVNGFAVIENFLTEDEANELSEAGLELCKNAPENDRKVFNTENKSSHLKDKYFLDSSNKIHYFYENGALDQHGNLLVDKSVSLNKVQW